MAVVFSHNSSLSLLRSIPPITGMLKLVDKPMSVSELSTTGGELSELDLESFGLTRPIHVLVADGKAAPKMRGVRAHRVAFAEFPTGSLWQLAPNIYVCGAELTFIQMSTHLGFVARVVLGCELCGDYSHFARMVSGFYDRPALTSAERIGQMTYLLSGARGVRTARSALRYVRDRSRSPMETVVNCMLFLPASEGGYGFVLPVLNHVVKLNAAASAITQTKICKVDTCWPDAKVGIEYDGEEAHADPEKDRRRREALAHLGWTIYVLVLEDVKSIQALERTVELFAARIPRAHARCEASLAERKKLLKSLFTFTRFGLGLNAALFSVPIRQGSVKLHLA